MAIVVPVYITVARDMVLLLQMLCGLANQSRHVDVLIVVDDASLICLPTFQINAAAQVTRLSPSYLSSSFLYSKAEPTPHSLPPFCLALFFLGCTRSAHHDSCKTACIPLQRHAHTRMHTPHTRGALVHKLEGCFLAQCLVMRLQENCGPAGARNTGLKLAHMLGVEVVSFLDADCLPHPDWLDRMHTCQQHRCGIVCGRTLASRGSTFIGTPSP